ncbi:MAG: hypothetical protein NTY77_12295 [Elusimicrobia bacterium]|nr:hypothetical protein [Elusimicrobiota bacterium]
MRAWLILALLCRAPAWAADPKYGPPESPLAVPLSQDHAYFRAPGHPAPDFWRLNSFYVPQINGYSCGAAAASMALNALLNAGRPRGDQDQNITQEELLDQVKGDWQALLSEPGLGGRHGLSLAQLEAFLKAGLAAYSKAEFLVERHEAAARGDRELKDFRRALAENEKNPEDLIIVHFVQDDLTLAKGGPYPHISPIGAYDAARKRVLVFDVDRHWYEPYWVPDEALLKALSHETAAFGHGGYIRIGKLGILDKP